MADNYQIDNTDRKILEIMMHDARTPYTEIAKQLYVSPGTVHVRMKKLTEMGIAKKTELAVDPARLGLDVTAFLGIFLLNSSLYDSVMEHLKSIDEIVSCHYTTGAYSMFLKIYCRDTNHLKKVLHDKIQKIEGIERTETIISLEESINRPISISTKKEAEPK